MCSPQLAIAIGAQVAGAALQNSATNRAEDAKALYRQENDARNRQREDEARAALDTSRTAMDRTNFDQGVNDTATTLAAAFDENTNRAAPGRVTTANTPKIVQDAITAAVGAAEQKNQEMNAKLAGLKSVGDYLKTTISPQLTDSNQIGVMNGSFIKGNSYPLMAELDAGNRLAYSPVAQILTGAGRAGFSHGLYSETGPIG